MITLHAPRKNGRHLRLAGEVTFGHGDRIVVTADLSPETIAWARQSARRLAQNGERWGRKVLSWARRNVQLRGDWSALGSAGEVAADVLATVAISGGPLLKPNDRSLMYAARHVLGSAPAGGPEPSLPHLQAASIAWEVLQSPDPYGAAEVLWACARGGDAGSQWILSAMCLMVGPGSFACCASCGDEEIVYNLEDAFGGVERTARRAVSFADNYRRIKATTRGPHAPASVYGFNPQPEPPALY